VLLEAAARARPERASEIRCAALPDLRREIARAIPLYRGIETLEKAGDSVQWGGERLYADGKFATSDGYAHFAPVPLPRRAGEPSGVSLRVSTRRGKQFNSMVQREVDPLTGASRRDVLMCEADAAEAGLSDGQTVRLVSESGDFHGRVRIAPIKPGNLEVHWPEGNTLLSDAVDQASGEPDYNASVRIEPEG
jgi:predicted molibdopterin-dependent oxidoreductase YjgC